MGRSCGTENVSRLLFCLKQVILKKIAGIHRTESFLPKCEKKVKNK